MSIQDLLLLLLLIMACFIILLLGEVSLFIETIVVIREQFRIREVLTDDSGLSLGPYFLGFLAFFNNDSITAVVL